METSIKADLLAIRILLCEGDWTESTAINGLALPCPRTPHPPSIFS